MTEILKVRLAARCEAAGRPENEDNFQVAEDLSVSNVGFTTDKIFPLGSKGTLLLVCDGMGGMNAGEVASDIGVETIKGLFAPQLITSEVIANDDSICAYMKRAIVKADNRIKEEAQKDSAKQGMGSTAVMAWLLGQKVYVAWCGDSRCYRFNPTTGLEQLSHDHSYVQDLVDTGQLSPDLAFDHPNKNIITRSMGDPRGAARPDAKVYPLRPGDVILLCSDGLHDSLRDSEIAQAISRSLSSMESCRDALWNDSCQAGWHDNVSIVLAQVVDENDMHVTTQPVNSQPINSIPATEFTKPIQSQAAPSTQPVNSPPIKQPHKPNWKLILSIVFIVILLAIGSFVVYKYMNNQQKNGTDQVFKGADIERYNQLYRTLSAVDFGALKLKDTKAKIKATRDLVLEFVELEDKLQIQPSKKSEIINRYNDQIKIKLLQLEDDNELYDEVKEMKYQ